MRALAALAVTLALHVGVARAAEAEHAAVVATRAFYAWELAHAGAGLPDAAMQRELSALLTPALLERIAAGRSTEDRCRTSVAVDEKPPLFEADVFVDNYEGATEVAIEAETIDGDSASVPARLFSVMEEFPKAHAHRVVAWRDVVVLQRVDGAWRVDDVQFAGGDTLRARVDGFVEANRGCVPLR